MRARPVARRKAANRADAHPDPGGPPCAALLAPPCSPCSPSPRPASAEVAHTVAPGETLWSIAAANNLTTRTVAAYNGLVGGRPGRRSGRRSASRRPWRATRRSSRPGWWPRPQRAATTAPAAAPPRRLHRPGGRHADRDRRRARHHGRRPRRGQRPRSGGPAGRRPLAHDPGRRAGARRGLACRARAARAPARRAATPCARATRSPALAAGAGVSVAEHGGDERPRSGRACCIAGTVIKLPSGAPAPAARRPQPAPAPVVPAADPVPTATRRRRRRHPVRRLAVRRLPLARRGDRVAGERLQQRRWCPRRNARGVMQVMPGTWDYVQQNLAAAARSTRRRRPTTSTPA